MMSQGVAGSSHCEPWGLEQSKGCQAQAEHRCSLVRCGEGRNSPSACRCYALCPVESKRPPTQGSQVRAKYSCFQLPPQGRRVLGVCLRLREEERAGRGSPATMGQVLSAPWQGSQPLHHLQPCTSASIAGTEQDPGNSPQGRTKCSLLLTFALSFSVCVLCDRADVDPDICGRTFAKSGICVHEFCLVSSSKGSFQLPATDAPFLSGLVKSCTFLSYRFLQLAFMVKEPHGRELVGSLFMLSDAQPSMQIRR